MDTDYTQWRKQAVWNALSRGFVDLFFMGMYLTLLHFLFKRDTHPVSMPIFVIDIVLKDVVPFLMGWKVASPFIKIGLMDWEHAFRKDVNIARTQIKKNEQTLPPQYLEKTGTNEQANEQPQVLVVGRQ